MPVVVATQDQVLSFEPGDRSVVPGDGLAGCRPTCLAPDHRRAGWLWCGTRGSGVFSSQDWGRSWTYSGLREKEITAVAVSPTEDRVVWVGTEPSALWRSWDGGDSWEEAHPLTELPSSSDWSFPPKPETHHVRWIACHPRETGSLWLAIEAGALIMTRDGGRTWQDRVPGGPFDTHELAIHPLRPGSLRVAAGDGYFESDDGGGTWTQPGEGLEVHYLRSVAIDPGNPSSVVVSGASGPRSAYVAGRSDGRVYRRTGNGAWSRTTQGWPNPPGTIAPLLAPGRVAGELWAADERGIHLSEDGGRSWRLATPFPSMPHHLRGLAATWEAPASLSVGDR